jgi:hypothetical protein
VGGGGVAHPAGGGSVAVAAELRLHAGQAPRVAANKQMNNEGNKDLDRNVDRGNPLEKMAHTYMT